MSSMPPQRMGGPGPSQGRGPGATAQGGGPGRGMSPQQGAQEAERRLGIPCYFSGQRVQGMFGCVACQLQIRPRPGAALPVCPQCGEMIWAYLESGPRPVPEGETAPVPEPEEKKPVKVEEGVRLDAPTPNVTVQEGVKLEP